ncbi:hypothetical protein TIFTF001_034129 [Ficus carica]|uniref:Uncharacterized protein n=1 Tax=Ficus carica TaxID=3494 RepID=A0AA88DZA7_FICCA|nr:hypothetical protein TIFTF001_034129 [Ficus carica]
MGTLVGYLLRTLQCLSVSYGFGSSSDLNGLYSKWSRRVDMLWVSLVLVQGASTVSVRSGGGGWRQSRDKDKYGDMYQMSGVRWYRVLSVARPVTGSVARVSTLEPDGDMLEVSQRRGNLEISSSTNVLVGQLGDSRKDSICSRDPTYLV